MHERLQSSLNSPGFHLYLLFGENANELKTLAFSPGGAQVQRGASHFLGEALQHFEL